MASQSATWPILLSPIGCITHLTFSHRVELFGTTPTRNPKRAMTKRRTRKTSWTRSSLSKVQCEALLRPTLLRPFFRKIPKICHPKKIHFKATFFQLLFKIRKFHLKKLVIFDCVSGHFEVNGFSVSALSVP